MSRKAGNLMTNTNSSNSSRSTTARYFTVDHFKHQIIGTEQNFKKSGILGSDQYNALMEVMAAHANYTLTVKVSDKKVEKKQTYKGLNTPLITEYVELFGNEAQKAELAEMIDNDEVFATIKSWFLDYFKCGFTVEKAKREIANRKLNARKAKVRTAVRVKTVKATPAAVVEMPTAANF